MAFPYLRAFKENFADIYAIAPHATLDALIAHGVEECPHMILYGPEGGLKNDYVRVAVAGLYGARADALKPVIYTHTITVNSVKHDVAVTTTTYSIEIWPSEIAAYDRYIMSDVIKPIISQRNPIHARHIVVLHDADRLSEQAMMCLRRMLELYHTTAIFVLVAGSISRIPNAIVSRCCLIRCPLLPLETVHAIRDRVIADACVDAAATAASTSTTDDDHDCRDIYKVLLRLGADASAAAATGDDVLYAEMQAFMDGLRKCRAPWTIYEKIKEYTHRVIHYQYTNIFRVLTRYLIVKYGSKSAELIAIVAEADRQLTRSTRPNFIYESMFMKCVTTAASLS